MAINNCESEIVCRALREHFSVYELAEPLPVISHGALALFQLSVNFSFHVSVQLVDGRHPDNVGVPYCTEKTALLLELSHYSTVIGLKEGGVEDLPSTGQVITLSLEDSSIGASTQLLSFYEMHTFVSKLQLVWHCVVTIRAWFSFD